jgi:hypothetical protein
MPATESVASPADASIQVSSNIEATTKALRDLPDGCACSVDELAARIGASKLALIGWLRSDFNFASLVASKVREPGNTSH